MTDRLPPPDLDLNRIAYVARHRADIMGLSYADLRAATGCSARQVSYLMNGKPISAGATYILTQVLDINLASMYVDPAKHECIYAAMARRADFILRGRDFAKKQTVTPPVSRETEATE